MYDFVYGELCDWYLELVKPRLRGTANPTPPATLLHVLVETLALAHPMIPFVTEEIYAHVPGAEGLLAAGIADQPARSTRPPRRRCARDRAVQAMRAWRASPRSRRARSSQPAWPRAGTRRRRLIERLARLAFSSTVAMRIGGADSVAGTGADS